MFKEAFTLLSRTFRWSATLFHLVLIPGELKKAAGKQIVG